MYEKYRYETVIKDVDFHGSGPFVANGSYACEAFDGESRIARVCGNVMPTGPIWLQHLRVDNSYRGQHIGTYLLGEFLRWAHTHPAEYVYGHMYTDESHEELLYWYIEKMGFHMPGFNEYGAPIIQYNLR